MTGYHSVVSRPTDGPQVPSEWSSGSPLIVCRFIITYHLCFFCCRDFIIYLWWSIKFKYNFKGIPFMPLILKFSFFLCWAKVGRWGGALDYMYSNWPEDWSRVMAIPSDSLRAGKVKILFKTFLPNLSNYKPKVYCWPAVVIGSFSLNQRKIDSAIRNKGQKPKTESHLRLLTYYQNMNCVFSCIEPTQIIPTTNVVPSIIYFPLLNINPSYSRNQLDNA